MNKKVILMILDGWGIATKPEVSAIEKANTPFMDSLFGKYSHSHLNASGLSVGLPDGQMGNSDVGHLTLGAGEVIRQDIVMINDAIVSGEIYNNTALTNALDKAESMQRPVHLLGLVSDGGVHSHIDHLYSLIKACKQHAVKPLLHMITDGRDTAPQSVLNGLAKLEAKLSDAGGARQPIQADLEHRLSAALSVRVRFVGRQQLAGTVGQRKRRTLRQHHRGRLHPTSPV